MDDVLKNNLSQIKLLLLQHGVESAYAFGSAVKGNMNANSDIDFIIRFPSGMDYVTYADNYFNLLHSLQDLLNTSVDLVTEKTLKNPFLIQSIDAHKVKIL